jgi:hypothetical protein
MPHHPACSDSYFRFPCDVGGGPQLYRCRFRCGPRMRGQGLHPPSRVKTFLKRILQAVANARFPGLGVFASVDPAKNGPSALSPSY